MSVLRRPSAVVVRPQFRKYISNTKWPIMTKFHVKHYQVGGGGRGAGGEGREAAYDFGKSDWNYGCHGNI